MPQLTASPGVAPLKPPVSASDGVRLLRFRDATPNRRIALAWRKSSAVGDFLYWFASEAGWGAGDYRIACAVVLDEGRTGSTQNTKA